MPSLIKRIALLPLGALLGVLLLEAVLQVGALAVRLSGQELPATWVGGRQRILCVGDSNTYGLYLADRNLAYPQQLERLWNAGGGSQVEVLNLGYPGTNSSRLRHGLPRMLETLRPDVVIVMVGSNDYWTAPAPAAPPAGVAERLAAFVRRWSRLYELVYMLRRAFDSRQLEVVYRPRDGGGAVGVARYGDVEFALGFQKAQRRPDHDAQLEANLRAIAAAVRDAGAEPVFMTYPSRMWNYGDASRLIRVAAEQSGTKLIDLAPAFAELCPTEPCPQWLYPDHHATADGYSKVAEALVRQLRPPPPP